MGILVLRRETENPLKKARLFNLAKQFLIIKKPDLNEKIQQKSRFLAPLYIDQAIRMQDNQMKELFLEHGAILS